jgi:hypothetical protein
VELIDTACKLIINATSRTGIGTGTGSSSTSTLSSTTWLIELSWVMIMIRRGIKGRLNDIDTVVDLSVMIVV